MSERMGGSGDVLADRRFAWAMASRAAGDEAGAADLLAQVVDLAPRWTAAWVALGEAREAMGDRSGAAEAYRAALGSDPSDVAGASVRLARLTGATPARLPRAHVAALFDDYAERFERHLTGALDYRAPALLRAALDRLAPERVFARALDLGCGTGLMGRAMRDRVKHLAGIDLSPAMVVKARASGLYQQLALGDAVEAARLCGGVYDLALAADVFVYLGALPPVLAALAPILNAGGLLAFTVQRGERGEVALGPDLRFSHSDVHLRRAAAETGFDVLLLEAAVLRRDAGQDVPGFLAVLAKRQDSAAPEHQRGDPARAERERDGRQAV